MPPLPTLPLSGLRVLEFTHAVMGPTAGLLLGDLGAERFCQVFERPDWAADPRLATNNGRIDATSWLLPAVEEMLGGLTAAELIAHCEAAGLPFSPIARPEDLFEDPQLNQPDAPTTGLLPTTLPDGTHTKLPRLPLAMGEYDFGLRHDPPAIGADTEALLTELGYSPETIQHLKDTGKLA